MDNPGRVIPIEVHFSAAFPLYSAEAYQRITNYYPGTFSPGIYVPPWLWVDGKSAGFVYDPIWGNRILARMNHPAPVTITMSGTYDPLLRSGVVNAQFRNDSTDAIKGRVIFVITEDSIYYEGPNGDNWHNHVPRDYLPDENGDTATILAGDSLTITQAFAIDPSWILAKCQIATWIQNDSMYADSTKEIWQAGVIDVADLPSMASEEIHGAFSSLEIAAFPNPCVDGTTFSFNLFKGLRYHINIFDVTGRNINNLNGTAKGGAESINWDGRDSNGNTLNSGIYFYQFRVNNGTSSGKIVVN